MIALNKGDIARIQADLELTAVSNCDLLGSLAVLRSNRLDCLDHIQALNNFAEHNVLSVQPLGLDSANEELRPVSVGTGVSHGQNSWTCVLVNEVLVLELRAVDRLSSGSVAGSEVSSLEHEVGDHSVEDGVLEMKGLAALAHSLLASAQGSEILSCLGNCVSEKLHDDSAGWLVTNSDVEKHSGVWHLLKQLLHMINQD